MGPQELTVAALTPLYRTDKFGNHTFNVKFNEYEQPVYAAFKTPPEIGSKKYGSILQGEYGPRFKSAQRPDFAPMGQQSAPQQYSAPAAPQAAQGRKSDEERSKDIRWGLCLKEANLYVTNHRPDLSAEDWAKEVNEYANALYGMSAAPGPVVNAVMGDQLPNDDDVDPDAKIPLDDIPF